MVLWGDWGMVVVVVMVVVLLGVGVGRVNLRVCVHVVSHHRGMLVVFLSAIHSSKLRSSLQKQIIFIWMNGGRHLRVAWFTFIIMHT